jgi:type IV pilus assembly protein PilM
MRTIGLDISDHILRLAVLGQSRRGYTLPVHGDIPLPSGAISDGIINQADVVVQHLQRLLSAAKPKTKRVVAAIPERHSFVKVLTLPADSPLSENAVQTEAAQYVPYTAEEMYTSWMAVPGESPAPKVVFGATPRSVIDTYLHVLERAGLEVVRLELESLALARGVLPANYHGVSIILDLGTTRSTLVLVVDGIVHFTTTLRYSGKDLDTYIAESLEITPDQARRAKEVFGLDPDKGKGLLAKILDPQLDALTKEITKVETFAQQHVTDRPVDQVFLTGGGAQMRGMADALGKNLNIPVEPQPVPLIAMLPPIEDADDVAYTYATAIGLAMEGAV